MSELRKQFETAMKIVYQGYSFDADTSVIPVYYYDTEIDAAWDGWQECAKIKDAEIERIREFYSAPLSTYLEIEELQKQVAMLQEALEPCLKHPHNNMSKKIVMDALTASPSSTWFDEQIASAKAEQRTKFAEMYVPSIDAEGKYCSIDTYRELIKRSLL